MDPGHAERRRPGLAGRTSWREWERRSSSSMLFTHDFARSARRSVRRLALALCAAVGLATGTHATSAQAAALPRRASAELRERMKAVADPDPKLGYAAYQELIPFGER